MRQNGSILKKNIGAVLFVILMNILSSLALTVGGYSLSFLFTAYEYEANRMKALLLTFAIVLAIWLIALGLHYLSLLARAKAERTLKNDLRLMIGEKIASMSYGEFAEKDCGNIVSWLTNDVELIYSQSFGSLFSCVENLATAVFSLGALFILSAHIGITAIVLLAIILALPQFTNKWLQKANGERSKAMEIGTEGYKDVIMGSTVFFLAGLHRRIVERIFSASEKAEKSNYRFNRVNSTVQTVVTTVSVISQQLLLLVTLLAAIVGTSSPGALLSVGNLAGSFFNGAGAFVQTLLTAKAAKPLWDKFKKEENETENPQRDISEIPSITLKNVSFGYGARSVLKNESFEFRKGGKYAIMGASGSGKSTLAKIILGLLPSYCGSVRYGDLEQREINLKSIHRNIAYVDQQVYLFQDTVRFNITLGQDYSDEEIMRAVKQCRLEDFIASLPQRLDTVIFENGKNLSGGQRQRIALARALIRKVNFIILDEGTSALDEANAVDIEMNLTKQSELGVIIITHHLRASVRPKLTAVYSLKNE